MKMGKKNFELDKAELLILCQALNILKIEVEDANRRSAKHKPRKDITPIINLTTKIKEQLNAI
ncbi:MAG: hypothetical protein JW976_15685 [Syntrophaceae bacterium]|nr:hypothetical protein [Syntrophaceae bacterium]